MREKKGKMSKIQETAPEEIFLIVGPTNDTDFKELSDVTWADKPVYEETAIKYIKQPKLSIPKNIAEELEQVAVTNWEIWEFFIYAEEFSTELKNWLNHGKDDNANSKIAIAYLAGKALGVELVGVQG